MIKWVKVFAGAIAVVGVLLLAYAVLTPQPATDTTDHMGFGSHMTYSTLNVSLIAFSTVLIVATLMVILLWQGYEPLPPTVIPAKAPAPGLRAGKTTTETLTEEAPVAPSVPQPTADEIAAKEYLVLRLLTGDERVMFKAIMDAGGEALQKDLILSTKMSNAKVSRVLDRLVQKGVITKERYGSTNKIRIRLE